MTHRKTIDLQVEVPTLNVNDKLELKEFSETIAKDLAEQIIQQVVSLHRADNIAYWKQVLQQWAVQDAIAQVKQDGILNKVRKHGS